MREDLEYQQDLIIIIRVSGSVEISIRLHIAPFRNPCALRFEIKRAQTPPLLSSERARVAVVRVRLLSSLISIDRERAARSRKRKAEKYFDRRVYRNFVRKFGKLREIFSFFLSFLLSSFYCTIKARFQNIGDEVLR